jgi:mannose-1-phosphate guanylyltransferase/mannose-1-phosphate guanylyltransferase/mannose-6-phosphate isomerase
VLSGGSGTRLWPLSVGARPKQFIDFFGGKSLFDATLDRARAIPGWVGVVVVSGTAHIDLVAEAVDTTDEDTIVLSEPSPRNTAPAIVAAALVADPDDILVVLPSDHLIRDTAAFNLAAGRAIGLAEAGGLVAFGCVPDRPEVGYGWIKTGEAIDGGFEIAEFVEKPDASRAEQLLSDGYLWNSGMFVAKAATILTEVEGTELLSAVQSAVSEQSNGQLSDAFSTAPAISFDHQVMEKTERGLVVPLDAGWSDIGSWHAVWQVSEKDDAGNVRIGDVAAVDSHNSLVRSTTRRVAVVGIDDVVVVETEDGVLVIPRERSQEVREIRHYFEENETRL